MYYHSGTLSNNSSFVLLSRLVTNRVLPGIGFFWVGNAMLLRIVVSSLYFANFLPYYMIIFQPFAPKLKIKAKPETQNQGFGYLFHPLSRSWNGRVTFSFENKRNDGFLHYHYHNTLKLLYCCHFLPWLPYFLSPKTSYLLWHLLRVFCFCFWLFDGCTCGTTTLKLHWKKGLTVSFRF